LEKLEFIDEKELVSLRDALIPIKTAVEALGREDTNLVTSEVILTFMFKKITEQNTIISKRLLTNLKERVISRRNINLISLAKYLKNPKGFAKHQFDFLPILPKTKTIEYGKRLMSRLFDSDLDQSADSELSNTSFEDGNADMNLSLNQQLNIAISAEEKCPSNLQNCSNNFKKECALFECSCERSKNLDRLYQSILSIRPTSTTPERVFSVSGQFCTKQRSRLNDSSLDPLVFLKFYFIDINQKK
jgi:hypothetical protein